MALPDGDAVTEKTLDGHDEKACLRERREDMTLQDFIIECRNEVGACLRINGIEDADVRDAEVIKTNDIRLHGIVIIRKGSLAGVNVYIDDLFMRYEHGEELTQLMEEVKMRCLSALNTTLPPVPNESSFRLENIRNRLTVRLLDVRSNRSYMMDRPYIDAGNGLVMVVQVNAEETITSEWMVTVNNSLLESMECTREQLLTAALSNTIRLEPPVLMRLKDFVFSEEQKNLLEEDDERVREERDSAYLLTNKSRFKGAAVLFYPGVMAKTADVLGCGYYVLPSSMHELIIIPDSFGMSIRSMTDMLHHGNEAYVDEEEFLSDRVFHYDPFDGNLRIASNGREVAERANSMPA